MKRPLLQSDALKLPTHLLQGCFGRSWELTRRILAYIRALERDLATEVARNATLTADRDEMQARYERATSDLERRDKEIGDLNATVGAIVRAAVRLRPGEEILITKESRRPLSNDAVRTNAEPDSAVNAVAEGSLAMRVLGQPSDD